MVHYPFVELGVAFRKNPLAVPQSAILVTLPIAIGIGAGSDLRQPLGVAVVGGLIVSQALTLFTTPVTYLYMEKFSEWTSHRFAQLRRRGKSLSEMPAE
jgi:multidrug efflux pump